MTVVEKASTMGRIFMEAIAHDGAGRRAEAERLLSGLVALDPEHADALHRLGDLRAREGRHEEALALLRRAIAQRPGAAVFHRTAAETLRHLARYDEALREADRSLALDPLDHHALMIRSAIHHDRLDFPPAFADAHRALAVRPGFAEAHLRLGELHLMHGAFAAGWPQYEWIGRIAGVKPVLPPARRSSVGREWNGEDLRDGTLLLIADQGFGDAIQFARYLPWAARACRHLAFACDIGALPLLAPIHPAVQAFNNWDHAPKHITAWRALSSLPLLHGTTLATIPCRIPYINADAKAVAGWRFRFESLGPTGARRIGLVWAGRPTHCNDRNRSTSLAALAPIAAAEGVFLVSLQQGPARDQIKDYRGAAPLLDVGRLVTSFSETAAVIENLDLVITVDTAVAHLAGAMGKPVWIMLPYAPDWRWMLGRDDSPWYPTARLFRQSQPRDWDGVARDIARALAQAAS